MDNTFFRESDVVDYEAFNNACVFHCGTEVMQDITSKLNEEREAGKLVSEFDVLNAIGIPGGRTNWGWSKEKGLHEFTVQELHPEGCPCCGKPW